MNKLNAIRKIQRILNNQARCIELVHDELSILEGFLNPTVAVDLNRIFTEKEIDWDTEVENLAILLEEVPGLYSIDQLLTNLSSNDDGTDDGTDLA